METVAEHFGTNGPAQRFHPFPDLCGFAERECDGVPDPSTSEGVDHSSVSRRNPAG